MCSGEGSSTANRVGQQMASRHREHVRSSNARVSSYVTMLQKFELSRQTGGSRCATETVGFVLSCLSLDIFGLGRYRDFRERSSLASNLLDRLLDGTSLSINVSLHEYALRMDVLQCMSDHSALVQTSSPRKTACCTSKPSTQST